MKKCRTRQCFPLRDDRSGSFSRTTDATPDAVCRGTGAAADTDHVVAVPARLTNTAPRFLRNASPVPGRLRALRPTVAATAVWDEASWRAASTGGSGHFIRATSRKSRKDRDARSVQ